MIRHLATRLADWIEQHILGIDRCNDPEDEFDPRPCQGRNANVCVAEGCYGEACRAVYGGKR